jgi:hypothetical protein
MHDTFSLGTGTQRQGPGLRVDRPRSELGSTPSKRSNSRETPSSKAAFSLPVQELCYLDVCLVRSVRPESGPLEPRPVKGSTLGPGPLPSRGIPGVCARKPHGRPGAPNPFAGKIRRSVHTWAPSDTLRYGWHPGERPGACDSLRARGRPAGTLGSGVLLCQPFPFLRPVRACPAKGMDAMRAS